MPRQSRNTSGLTQLIRSKLHFSDELRWRKFSARRLELIDRYALSSRMASEQDSEIAHVADILRLEFNYPPACLSDFDKLVRFGIQSVRRNRRRQPRPRPLAGTRATQSVSDDDDDVSSEFEVDSASNTAATATVTAIAATVTATATNNRLPSLAMLSLGPGGDSVAHLLAHLRSLLNVTGPVPVTCTPGSVSAPDNCADIHKDPLCAENTLVLGSSLCTTAAALALESTFPSSHQHTQLRACALSEPVTRAIGAHVCPGTDLRCAVARAALPVGLDQLVPAISALYKFLFTQTAHLPANKQQTGMADLIPSSSPSVLPPAHLHPANLDSARVPVTLRLMDKQLHMTYCRTNNSPPSLAELLSSAKLAFGLVGDHHILRVMDLNRARRVLDSDQDIADTFARLDRVDLEVFFPISTTTRHLSDVRSLISDC